MGVAISAVALGREPLYDIPQGDLCRVWHLRVFLSWYSKALHHDSRLQDCDIVYGADVLAHA
eukprot:5993126-Amphidinium_carterae.2